MLWGKHDEDSQAIKREAMEACKYQVRQQEGHQSFSYSQQSALVNTWGKVCTSKFGTGATCDSVATYDLLLLLSCALLPQVPSLCFLCQSIPYTTSSKIEGF